MGKISLDQTVLLNRLHCSHPQYYSGMTKIFQSHLQHSGLSGKGPHGWHLTVNYPSAASCPAQSHSMLGRTYGAASPDCSTGSGPSMQEAEEPFCLLTCSSRREQASHCLSVEAFIAFTGATAPSSPVVMHTRRKRLTPAAALHQ